MTRFTSLGVLGTVAIGGVALGITIAGVTGTSGTKVLTVNQVVYSSGGVLPIYGDFSLTEITDTAKYAASGALSIINPYDQTLLCESPILNITTAMTSETYIDVYTATGGTTSVGLGTGSSMLKNDFRLKRTGVYSLSGTALFRMSPYSATAAENINRINIKTGSSTNLGIVGTYYVPCYAID